MADMEQNHELKTLDRQIKPVPKCDATDDSIDLKKGTVQDLDHAEIFLREHDFDHAYLHSLLQDERAVRKLRQRVDWILMPLLCGTYMLQYIDKQSLSYSAVFDLFDSTGTTSSQYSWLVSIFYFGYLFFEWPASYMAQRFPTGTVSIFVIVWGSILMLTAACSNFQGLAACRFLLGCCEALITPTFMMIVSMFYTRKEQPARAGLFYCFNGVGSSVGGILFFGVGQYHSSFPVWRTIFLLCGGVTFLWGFVLLYFLPNNIMTAKRFTEEERAPLIARSMQNQTGIYHPKIKPAQVLEAFRDPQIWLLFLFTLPNETINGGFANFGKLIVKDLAGDNDLLTTAYGIPSGAWQVFFVLGGPWLASKFKNIRTYVMMAYLCPTVISLALLFKIDHSHSKGLLVAYYICSSYVASLVIALQLPASNTGGYTKRVTATTLFFLAYCAGNIIGPHAFLKSEAPVYETGCSLGLACASAQIVIAFALRMLLIHRNRSRDRKFGVPEAAGEEEVIEDVTD